jgi:hypothetical protein
MAIKWRPATEDDIGMPCRFHDGNTSNLMYGELTDVGSDMPFPFERDSYFCYGIAEVAERDDTRVNDNSP